MPLDSHSASGAACWGFPPSPHERRISFCGCASVGRFEPCPGLPLGMVFFLFCIVFRLHIQQTIHDLMDTHLILERKQGNSICYEITPEGQKTLSYFEKNMSDSIRLEVDSYILEKGYEMRNENSITAEYYRTPEQEYTVQLGVLEKNAPLIQLKITVPTEEMAKNLCHNWPKRSQEIYASVMTSLS